ncbi:hypothetical protein AB7C87_06405 [Natrarchaeobius sp. A-rgal3]|uniref:hypothetical protein n=1 Tax=Natrarchaeobius versutus TaxID=1679078 RepID=UPI00350FAC04
MVQRRRLLTTFACTIGSVILGGCQSNNQQDNEEITVGYTAVSPPGRDAGEPGWVLVKRTENIFSVTFDVRLCGAIDDVSVDQFQHNEYVLNITGQISDNGDCQPTRLLGGVEVPTEQLSLQVEINNDQIKQIERDGTTTSLHDLPDLVHNDNIG